MESAINATNQGGGGDEPEAYTRALHESYADNAIAWRSDARRFVVMFGDYVPHDDNINERVASPPIDPGDVWRAHVSPYVLDPGRDGVSGTADDLDLQIVLDTMHDHRMPLLFARNVRVPVWAIGLGPDVSEEVLRAIAGGTERVRLAPSPDELVEVYGRIAREIP